MKSYIFYFRHNFDEMKILLFFVKNSFDEMKKTSFYEMKFGELKSYYSLDKVTMSNYQSQSRVIGLGRVRVSYVKNRIFYWVRVRIDTYFLYLISHKSYCECFHYNINLSNLIVFLFYSRK